MERVTLIIRGLKDITGELIALCILLLMLWKVVNVLIRRSSFVANSLGELFTSKFKRMTKEELAAEEKKLEEAEKEVLNDNSRPTV